MSTQGGAHDADPLPLETIVEAVPIPTGAIQATLPVVAAIGKHQDSVTGGNGTARISRTTTPSSGSGGRSWADLAGELQRLKDHRRRGQLASHGSGAAHSKANGHANQDGRNATPSLWSQHAGIAAASLWEASTPVPLTPPPDDRQAASRPETSSADDGSGADAAVTPQASSLWEQSGR